MICCQAKFPVPRDHTLALDIVREVSDWCADRDAS